MPSDRLTIDVEMPLFRTPVLLYSGGLDSFIAAHAEPRAKLLYIDTRARYSAKELRYITSNMPRDITIDTRLDLSGQERDDGIVPARNLLLVTLASHYGTDIILAATAGDRSTDKDDAFANMSSDLLSHIYSGVHFQGARGVVVRMPFKQATKAEMVRWYLDSGFPTRALSDCISCYHPEELHCGQCKACLRKWVALAYNHCDMTPWRVHPSKWEGWRQIVLTIQAGGSLWRHPREDQQTLAVLGVA